MRDIPIKNSYIFSAAAFYWAAGLLVGLPFSTMVIQTAIAIIVTIALYFCLGGSLGGGVCKGIGVAYLWLGFSTHFMWFVGLTFFFLAAVSLGVKLANPKVSTIPALPVMIVVMAIMFPQGELGQKILGSNSPKVNDTLQVQQ